MFYQNFAEDVKNHLEMKQILQFYGVDVNSKGFACCPFHSERTASFKCYQGDRGYFCFGCGESGDVITFVQKFFNLTFNEAIKKLNDDFNLFLFERPTLADYRQRERQKKIEAQKREKAKQEKEQLNNEYFEVLDEFLRIKENRKKYKPKNQDEALHPLFVEALQKYEHLYFELENLKVRGRELNGC